MLVAQRIRFLGRDGDVFGVVGKKPIHLMKTEEREKASKMTDLFSLKVSHALSFDNEPVEGMRAEPIYMERYCLLLRADHELARAPSVAWAAGRVAARPEFASKNVVTFFYDTGERYLSVEGLFDDESAAED